MLIFLRLEVEEGGINTPKKNMTVVPRALAQPREKATKLQAPGQTREAHRHGGRAPGGPNPGHPEGVERRRRRSPGTGSKTPGTRGDQRRRGSAPDDPGHPGGETPGTRTGQRGHYGGGVTLSTLGSRSPGTRTRQRDAGTGKIETATTFANELRI